MASNPLLPRIPRSLTAPDAWLAILLASFLQYAQYARRRDQWEKGYVVHAGAKAKPKRHAARTLVHEWLFTNLRMMVSPISDQASRLNAGMVVDLQSDRDLDHYAREAAAGRMPKKKTTKNISRGGDDGDEKERKTIEVRSRRIARGEMVYADHYPLLETTVNLSLANLVGLASRWLLGLIRSLTLSSVSSSSMSPSGLGGVCCSPYRGSDDDGSRVPGAFERLMACVLIKKEGDDAGILLLTLLLVVFIVVVVKLAWSVSPFNTKTCDLDDEADADIGKDNEALKRIDPKKATRFLVGLGSALFSFWLFCTPALLRALGLDGLPEAVEELSARVLLLGNILGVVSLPATDTLGKLSGIGTVMNALLAFLALAWGYIASSMMTPIEETARNAAHILSLTPPNKKMNPNEMMDLINVRMMLLIQALAPFMIMCTYLFHTRFSDTTKASARDGQIKMSFSKRHLQHSGLFVRGVLSWCFLAAFSYCLRSLLQSYLDQAATVASAVGVASNDVDGRQGTINKRNPPSILHTSPAKIDPFNDRYKNLVRTAGRITAFPALVLAMLTMAHLRGGDGSTHPGVGYESQPKHAPRSMLLANKLLPPYSDLYMSWISKQVESHRIIGVGTGDGLLHVAALSQASWHPNPLRDSTHQAIVNWLGKHKFCYPPEVRSVKAMGRNVNFLLGDEGDGAIDGMSILTMQALSGRELLEIAPQVPMTFIDILLGRTQAGRSCNIEEDSNNNHNTQECTVSEDVVLKSQQPSLSQMFSFIISHHLFTPTVIFPIIDMLAFLGCVWWNYWYSVMMCFYWIKIRRTPFLQVT
ncbi:hypothetical protein ACHAW5_008370 [Stephanodiscus triporus]|uniref:Uncharacterized protein n=2 Tax=Stephanodiscus triporus TaxID=2934178 RepID=A0ABD3MJY2_9STRA